MENENEDYDFEERAAIREFDGDQPRGTAEFFAHEEIAARKAQQGCLDRHNNGVQKSAAGFKGSREPPANHPPVPKKQELQMLQDQRDEVSKQMRAETNEQRKKELMTEWMNLTTQIIKLRKGT